MALVTKWRSIYIISAGVIIEAMKISMVANNGWPYLKSLDDNVDEQFFGIVKTIYNLANIMATVLCGWVCNRLSDTKPIIMFGIVFKLTTAFIYANIETLPVGALRKWTFLFCEICYGIAFGAFFTWRAFIPMASREEDRQKAFALTSVSINFGNLISALIIIPIGYIFATAIPLPWGSHLSIYTAPVYMLTIFQLVSAIFLGLFFDGRMEETTAATETAAEETAAGVVENLEKQHSNNTTDRDENGSNNNKRCTRQDSVSRGEVTHEHDAMDSNERSDSLLNPEHAHRPDWIAIAACFMARICLMSIYSYMMALSTAFQMASFGWTGEQMVTYGMAVLGVTGVIGILIGVGYALRLLQSVASERFCIRLALALMLAFFLLTFQWPFLSAKMPNCDLTKHSWCASTPATNAIVYNAAFIVCIGLALPIGFQNLDVLYSKLLGPIKQGTMQGIYFASSTGIGLVAPSLINTIYQHNGPQMVWLSYIAFFAMGNLFWNIAYARLVPASERKIPKNCC